MGVVTRIISLIGYGFAMRYAPPPAAQAPPDRVVL